MNIETINKWLDEEYGCSYTKLEELHNFYFEKYCDLQQENRKQKEVIDKAIEYIKKRFYFNEETGEYSLLHTFNKDNIKELLDILKEASE